jgi:hypothetical protein
MDKKVYTMMCDAAYSKSYLCTYDLYGPKRNAFDFIGPQMALAYRLDAISQGPKMSRFPGPNPLPLAQVMDAACIKSIMHRAV